MFLRISENSYPTTLMNSNPDAGAQVHIVHPSRTSYITPKLDFAGVRANNFAFSFQPNSRAAFHTRAGRARVDVDQTATIDNCGRYKELCRGKRNQVASFLLC